MIGFGLDNLCQEMSSDNEHLKFDLRSIEYISDMFRFFENPIQQGFKALNLLRKLKTYFEHASV